MSLLSNLLAYSSLNHCGQTQQRSSSASSKFLFDLDDNDKVIELKQRVVSKSLSKMGLLSNTNLSNSKIDPKYRCLHRIAHNLNMKVRKQYYALFVTLETISKNHRNKQNQKQLKISNQKVQNAILKISQTFSIRYLKQYQNSYKEQSYKKIKQFGSKAHLIKTIDKINVNNKYKFYGMKLFRYFNELDKLKMKFQLVQSAIEPILKKYNNMQVLDSFQNIKLVAKQQKQMKKVQQMAIQQKQERKSIRIFDMFQTIQRKDSQTNDNKLQIKQNRQKHKIQPDLFISQKSNIIVQPNLQQLQQLKKYENINQSFNNQRSSVNINFNNFQQSLGIYENKFHSLYGSPRKNSQYRNKSPVATSKKVPNLKQSVQKDRLDLKFYQKIYKSYQITTNYQEKPFQLISQYQSMPKIMHKIAPQEFGSEEVSDLADKSNIFRDFQSSKISNIDNLQISNVVGEPFMRADTLISQIQRNRDRYQTNSISQLSYTSYLNHQSTLSIINQKQQSNFGCDAVNFKNSLVMQRESMKKAQRQKIDIFIKKKTLINSEDLVDHQSQQLKNLRNRKKNHKQLQQRKTIQEIMSTNYKNNYQFQPEYSIKNQTNYQNNRANNLTLQPNYNNIFNWQNKKPHHQYNSESKNKSLSFNSKADELVPRRLRFDLTDFDKKSNDDSFLPNFYSTSNTFRENFSWKTDLIENKMQLPVKDVGLDPISKIRAKNNYSLQSQTQINQETPTINKKFINISKR